MVNVNIDKEKIHSMARELKQQLAARSFTNTKDKQAGFNLCLQMTSQSLFSKPYEEVLSTLLKPSDNAPSDELSGVVVLSYGAECIITLNGEYYTSSAYGSDMEVHEKEITRQAESLARTMETTVKYFALPKIAGEDWGYDDVIKIASIMGVFNYPTTIFEMFENSASEVFIGNCHILYKLNGEWESEVEEALEEDDADPLKHCVWFAEYTTEDMEKLEWYITLGDLCNATPIKGTNNSWWIEFDEEDDCGETGIAISFKL